MPPGKLQVRSSCQGQRGFTYVWVLAAIALLAIGLAAIGPSWSDLARRERETDLLRVGALYAGALQEYYSASPGSLKQYPNTLRELTVDTRMVGTIRHLRKLYPDPLEPTRAWGLVLDASGRIRGVYSQSTEAPLRREPLELGTTTLPAAKMYSDWKFIANAAP